MLALDFPMVHGRGDWPIRTIQIRMTSSQRRLSWLASLFTGIWLTWQFSISVIFLLLFTLSFISSYVIIHFLHNKYSLVIFKHAFYYTLKWYFIYSSVTTIRKKMSTKSYINYFQTCYCKHLGSLVIAFNVTLNAISNFC